MDHNNNTIKCDANSANNKNDDYNNTNIINLNHNNNNKIKIKHTIRNIEDFESGSKDFGNVQKIPIKNLKERRIIIRLTIYTHNNNNNAIIRIIIIIILLPDIHQQNPTQKQ